MPLAGGEPTEIPSIPYLYGLILGYVHNQSSLLMGGSTVSGTRTTAPLWPEGDDPPLVLVTVPTWTARRVGSLRSALAALSPDERELALVYGPGRRRLGLARIDGSGFRPLLELASTPLSLAWAPDGRRLRFTAAGPAGHAAEAWTWETSVAGEAPRPLWPGLWGQWSGSGGDFLLARGEVEKATFQSRYDLFAVREEPWRPWLRSKPADGGLPEVLAAPPPGQDGYWDACFLPDGEHVVFSRLTHGLFQVDASAPGRVSPIAGADALVYPKCARQGHILASGPTRTGAWGFRVRWAGTTVWKEIDLPNLAYPNWTRDGQAIVGLVPGSQQVVRVTLATGRRETLADLGATPLVVWVTVPWIGLAADDTPLVTLDRGTRGFYALDWEVL